MKTSDFLSAAWRACMRILELPPAVSGVSPQDAWPDDDQPLVAALCLCVLGEGGDVASDRWPPASIAELLAHAARSPAASTFGIARQELDALLAGGLAALDAGALEETGRSFAQVDRSRQLRTLFRLEAGQLALPRPRAAAFVDAFLTLAAQAYLCDALDATPPHDPPAEAPRGPRRALATAEQETALHPPAALSREHPRRFLATQAVPREGAPVQAA